MKRQLLKLSVVCVALVIAGQSMAQKSYTALTTTAAITIDGEIDAIWDNVTAEAINVPFKEETVSYTEDATFKMCWDDDNLYVLVVIPDDDYFPHTEASVNSWQADKVELYFDPNATVAEGGGPSDDAGHYQFAPGHDETPTAYGFAFTIDGDEASWICEYSIPFADQLNSIEDVALDPYSLTTIGMDVTIIDLDEDGKGDNVAMGRIGWNNDGSTDESWSTLDYSGSLVFSTDEVPATSTIKEKASNVNVLASTVVSERLQITVPFTGVQVINGIGQVVKTDVNVSDLKEGIYIAVVRTNKGDVANRFLIKK